MHFHCGNASASGVEMPASNAKKADGSIGREGSATNYINFDLS